MTTTPLKASEPIVALTGRSQPFAPPGQSGFLALTWRQLKRDRSALVGSALILLLVFIALFAPILSPHDPTEQFRDGLTADGQPMPSTILADGSWRFPLGTDANGRDLLSRILYGARVSLIVGVLAN